MSNLPERIKAWPWNNHTYAGQWHVNGRGETTEYVRADLFDAVKAERDALEARVKALSEALDERQDSGRDFWMKWTQKRLETRNAMFLRDAKLALGGDMRALRTRVEMMEAEPMQIVLSAALQENTDATNP